MSRNAIGCSIKGGQEIDADLALLNTVFVRLFDRLPQVREVRVLVRGYSNGLDEELVAAFGI